MSETDYFEDMFCRLVVNNEWEEIYHVSSTLQREVSILIDASNSIWIDWGDQSEVTLSPPYGAKLPFKLWVHTHPNMPAYWSATDQASLRIASNILDTAYVLGRDGLLFTISNLGPDTESIPGLTWSREDVTPWDKVAEVIR